jgi:ribosomal protein S24E
MYTPVHLMMMANMSIVMQLVRCAMGGLNWEAVMQSGKDRDAGYTMVEVRHKRMVGKRKRKSQIISRRQAKAVCGRHAKRVWKREDVRRVIVAEAGSDEEEIISSLESNVVSRGRHVRSILHNYSIATTYYDHFNQLPYFTTHIHHMLSIVQPHKLMAAPKHDVVSSCETLAILIALCIEHARISCLHSTFVPSVTTAGVACLKSRKNDLAYTSSDYNDRHL